VDLVGLKVFLGWGCTACFVLLPEMSGWIAVTELMKRWKDGGATDHSLAQTKIDLLVHVIYKKKNAC